MKGRNLFDSEWHSAKKKIYIYIYNFSLMNTMYLNSGRESVIGSVLLRAGRCRVRTPAEERVSGPVQTSSEAQPAACRVEVTFPGVKRSWRGVDRPPPCSVEVQERVELYLYLPSVPAGHVTGQL
jgi:hypothetical protein